MSFCSVFTVTFLIGLGGAMSPGPLLTYSIIKSVEAKKKAFKVGLYISTGHTLIELLLILILILGLGLILSYPIVLIIIGILGGGILIFFSIQIILDIKKKKIDMSFLESTDEVSESNSEIAGGRLYKTHPIVGSILFLMSNPYWWLWWSTAGLSIILENSVSFQNLPAFFGLIVGKELGVYLWYTFISTAVGLSSKFITKKIYIGILIVCALFMLGYGGYLIISPLVTLI
jgi:threonine/homoserine/homoserine lactone efflux protein